MWDSIRSRVRRPLAAVKWQRQSRRQEVYDGRGQAGETLLSAPYPKHTPMLENFIPGDVMMHSSTSGDILALQGESKAWCLEELALSAALFMPIGARSVCPSSRTPPLLGSPGMWPMWYLEKSAVPFLRSWSDKAQEEWSNVSLQGLSACGGVSVWINWCTEG